jgi:hypothetical protein
MLIKPRIIMSSHSKKIYFLKLWTPILSNITKTPEQSCSKSEVLKQSSSRMEQSHVKHI